MSIVLREKKISVEKKQLANAVHFTGKGILSFGTLI